MKRVFIDGSAGTTGLRIFDRLSKFEQIELVTLPEERRKDPDARREALNNCDVAFLCLPDAAAIEAVSMLENPDVTVLDTSTAHRTDPAWAYGFPELSAEHESKVINGKRIAVPGCHACGFIALVYPLIEKGIVSRDMLFACHSITGYSGGGKKMIAEYDENAQSKGDAMTLLDAPRQYGLTQQHKHLKEMKAITGINNAPMFSPIVSNFYSGMVMTVPIFASQLCEGKSVDDIKAAYAEKYASEIVAYKENADENGFFSAAALNGKDKMEITVAGNDERILLLARYDNLGKGASGAAIECMNLNVGFERTRGLEL